MSLILEALRKSEAERRRGQVPDLHAEPSPGAQPLREGPSPRLWLALALATALVLAIALWLTRSTPPVASSVVDAPAAATGTDGSEFTGSNGDARPGDESIGSVESTGTRADRTSTGATPASMPEPRRPSTTAPQPAAPSAAAAPSTPPATAPASTKIVGPIAPPAVPAPAPARPPSATVVAAASPTDPTPPAAVPSAATATPGAAAPESSPLRLSDLTGAQRQQLPPLKMSMHMYSPTQRFAIIDGTRVAAGDRIGGAVVEEITANGVVLAWQGQRLQIPLR